MRPMNVTHAIAATAVLIERSKLQISYILDICVFELEAAMSFSVMVHTAHGQFEATLVGAPDVRATAPTRAGALAALETVIEKRVEQGELVTLQVGRKGLA